MSRKKNLLDDSDDDAVHESNGKPSFNINRGYADSYNKWREKEEFQKLKDRYGDAEESESSETESDDFDPEDLNPEAEKDFLTVLSALKGKNPEIYDNSKKFFDEIKPNVDEKSSKNEKKVEKPMFLKDYERKVIVEKQGKLVDEDDDADEKMADDLPYSAQQLKLKESFKVKLGDDDEDFLIPRQKTDEEKKKEDADFLEWLKGRKKEINEENDKKKLKSLHDYWNDPKLEEGEKFLKDYLLNRKFFDADADNDNIPSYEEIVEDEEDEKILEAQEEFEHKYNFRFEEPDADFIKSYPRTVKDSLRRKDESKKQKRDSVKERKEKQKQQKREEIKRLKNLKKKEIFEKLQKLKEITGQNELFLDPDELNKDFDPADYDKKMKELFDDKFYSKVDEDEEKPTFTPSDSDETDEEALEDWQGNEPSSSSKGMVVESDGQEDACESKRKKPSKFLEAVKRKKPVFDPDEKSFEKYFDEYYKLDCEDIIAGDTVCRFKYRKVTPNDFGLSTEEILRAKPKELNAWVSVRKMSQYRTESDEVFDVNAYKRKAEDLTKKQRILTSLYKVDEDPVENEKKKKKKVPVDDDSKQISELTIDEKWKNSKLESATTGNSTKRKRKRKLPIKVDAKLSALQSLPDERLKAYGLNPKKLKNKLKYKKVDF